MEFQLQSQLLKHFLSSCHSENIQNSGGNGGKLQDEKQNIGHIGNKSKYTWLSEKVNK